TELFFLPPSDSPQAAGQVHPGRPMLLRPAGVAALWRASRSPSIQANAHLSCRRGDQRSVSDAFRLVLAALTTQHPPPVQAVYPPGPLRTLLKPLACNRLAARLER